MHDKIYNLAFRFRQAIEKARDKGELDSDPALNFFLESVAALLVHSWQSFFLKMILRHTRFVQLTMVLLHGTTSHILG